MKRKLKKGFAVLLTFAMFISVSAYYSEYDADADTETILTSSELVLDGFQIKTNVTSDEGIAFRTVCTAPDKGSIITVDGKNYTVKNFGTIYALDPNTDGENENNVLDASYTLLNPLPEPQPGADEGTGYKYIGRKDYNGVYNSFGFIATDKGVKEEKDGYTSYFRTILNMDTNVTNSLYIRAFVEAADENGKDVIIYSEEIFVTCVAQIASKVYERSLVSTQEQYDYIYDNILHKLPTSNKYYLSTPGEFNIWSPIAPVL